MQCPAPILRAAIVILICLGEIHLLSGIDLISAIQLHLLLFFLTLKHIILFSAALSCAKQVFSLPLIMKYPPPSYLHSPVISASRWLYCFNTQILDFNIIGSFPI